MFRAAPRRPEFGGAGLYACTRRGRLLYIGKFLGTEKNHKAGSVVGMRWVKHLGTLTMRVRNLGFSRKSLSEIAAHPSPEDVPRALAYGLAIARPERLARPTGCMTTYSRFQVASRIWAETDGDPQLEAYNFIYARVVTEASTAWVRERVSTAEDLALSLIHPPVNSLSVRNGEAFPDEAAIGPRLQAFLEESLRDAPSPEMTGTRTPPARRSRLVRLEPEETDIASGFEERLALAPDRFQSAIESLVDWVAGNRDLDVYYTKMEHPDLRIRLLTSGGIGYTNLVRIKWQPSLRKFQLGTKLSSEALQAIGLDLLKVGGRGLSHLSDVDDACLSLRPDILIEAVVRMREQVLTTAA